DACMPLLHETVEMDPTFRRDRCRVEEEVHQHRLAAPDAAVEIETRHHLLHEPVTPPAEKPEADAFGPAGIVVPKPVGEDLELFGGHHLGRVGIEPALRDAGAVEGDWFGHGIAHASLFPRRRPSGKSACSEQHPAPSRPRGTGKGSPDAVPPSRWPRNGRNSNGPNEFSSPAFIATANGDMRTRMVSC